MCIFPKIISVVLSRLTKQPIDQLVNYSQTITMDFEKLVCTPNSSGILSSLKCDVKHISRRHLIVDISGNLSKPLRGAYLHIMGFRKYNSYQRYGSRVWKSMCGWLAGKEKSFFLDWTLKRVPNYTNINHPRPYEGNIYIKINNISVDHFKIPTTHTERTLQDGCEFNWIKQGKCYCHDQSWLFLICESNNTNLSIYVFLGF